ncbi:hypothetical protein J8F10_19420 [Gemmata sp. G18]|uniref:Uncharacterized protein n=2 Tax=Gemmata palustris TaxID=2822762 RepID=A0ABS5BUM5_9BACT|nr:hypothetical protein [Gemmata palustris]MBP3957422.1 hypothetical protein [Gemmata palustris]
MALAGVKTLALPSISVTSIDTSHLGLTSYQKTMMPGMITNAAISVSLEFSESAFTTLHGMLRDMVDWRITCPADEPAVVTFSGFITKIDTPFSPDEEVMISLEITPSGDVSIA